MGAATNLVAACVPPRSARRLRLLAAHERTLATAMAKVASGRQALENAISDTLGFKVPVRGQRLIDEVARVEQAGRS